MKTYNFKRYEQAKEFLQALDEINENNVINYVASSEEDGYKVYVTFNKNANELDMYIVDDIAIKILVKLNNKI